MRTVEHHQAVVAELIRAPGPRRVDLLDAAGRVLAVDYRASRALPGFDNSAMDGYAVRAVDLAGVDAATPVTLPVVGDIPAGRTDVAPLEAGTAQRIMTGALLPAGADTIVQLEATDGGTTEVTVFEARAEGTHVRVTGVDVQAGDSVLPAGVVLGPAQLGLLAALGEPDIEVRPPLRVLVLSTGSELVDPGQPLRPGQVYDANSVMLTSAVEAAGGRAEHVHSVVDDVDQFHAALEPWLGRVDLVLTSGGVSAGAYEVVKDALTDRGVEFVKVAMQPGMPQGAGRLGSTAVVTMPGNSVSALVSFEVFVRPALRAAMGYPDPSRRKVRARLTQALDSPLGKRQFQRGHYDPATGLVGGVGPSGSHFLRGLAVANCLIDIPEDTSAVPVDASVTCWLLTDAAAAQPWRETQAEETR